MFKDKINQVNDSWFIIFFEIATIIVSITGIIFASIYLIPNIGKTVVLVLVIVALSLVGIKAVKLLIIVITRLYRFLAKPSLRNRCRFQPTCSHYMIVSLRKHILVVGLFKGLRRISRCHPPYGGIDNP